MDDEKPNDSIKSDAESSRDKKCIKKMMAESFSDELMPHRVKWIHPNMNETIFCWAQSVMRHEMENLLLQVYDWRPMCSCRNWLQLLCLETCCSCFQHCFFFSYFCFSVVFAVDIYYYLLGEPKIKISPTGDENLVHFQFWLHYLLKWLKYTFFIKKKKS